MAEETTSSSSIPKAPIGALGALAAIVLAGAAYAVSNRTTEDEQVTPGVRARAGGMKKRLGLMAAIAVIENDTTRKLLLTTLKAMAKRA